ncbi:MAG TPA: hypothetical protein VGV35_20900 [Bryobacteraceae bacterium]|nr:hypothetical protein [Bryobacteraceae bacterium]
MLALCGAGTVGAQNTPEMREVLKRLDRLEQDNRSLSEEVHALRKELAGVRAPTRASAAEVASDGQGVAGPAAQQSAERQSAEQQSAEQQSADERLDVQQSRLDEMAQTKVESSQKFPLRITGMALFNASVNGRHNNDADNPTTASLVPEDLTGGGTLRQSTIGLLFDGPKTFGGAKVSGSFYMDFFGGSTASLNHLVRLRTAGIHLDWANTSMMAGQDKPLISPRDPESLAQVGVSPLTSAGNPWLWQPQVRLEQRFGLGSYGGVVAQLAVYQTSFLNATTDVDTYVPAAEHSRPGAEGRLQLWRRWGETGRLEIAGGIHANRNRVGQVAASTNVYSMDWFFRPWAKLEFSGMFFHGRNVAVLGALRPGFTVFPGGRIVPVRSNGGWGQMRIPITSRVAFNFYGGQQSNYEADILAGNISSNAAYFANVMYRFAPNVILSFEGGQVRTNYFRIGTRLNDHYDLAIAYLF